MNMDIWVVGTSNQLFLIDPSWLPILFVVTLASGKVVLYGDVAFSILVLSIKKQYSSF